MVTADSIEITDDELKELRSLINRYLPGTEVQAFGSRVKGTCRSVSDLDLVIFPGQLGREDRVAVEELREALQESNLPFRVDMHVWEDLPEEYQENIRAQKTAKICERGKA